MNKPHERKADGFFRIYRYGSQQSYQQRFDDVAFHDFYETPTNFNHLAYFEAHGIIEGTEKRISAETLSDFQEYPRHIFKC